MGSVRRETRGEALGEDSATQGARLADSSRGAAGRNSYCRMRHVDTTSLSGYPYRQLI